MDPYGKTAVITGGAQGLGKGFACAVLDGGGNVVIADVQTDAALELVKVLNSKYGTGRSMFMKCDVTDADNIQDVLWKTKAMFGQIDILVNNAGISQENLATILVNLHGVILGTQYALQLMSKAEGGRGGVIVNIGSTAGLTVVPFQPVYSATKYGVVGYTRAVAARKEDTEDENIRVVCLCPSFTETKMFTQTGSEGTGRSPIVSSTGIMTVPRVVTAFVALVTDANNNGGIMAVTPKEMEYKYPRKWRTSKSKL